MPTVVYSVDFHRIDPFFSRFLRLRSKCCHFISGYNKSNAGIFS